jgi:hypothetical protein
MKYLKKFNESNLGAAFFYNCKDILLELEDIGIKTNYDSYLAYNEINPINIGREKWISFHFSRKEEFDYSDIEDVVERLKSYISNYGLSIEWLSPKERREQRPTIKTTSIMNPMTFTPDGVVTRCELHFN